MWKTNTKISNCLASKQQFCWWANWSYFGKSNRDQSIAQTCDDEKKISKSKTKQLSAFQFNKVLGCLNVLVKLLLLVLFSMFGCVASVKKRLSYLRYEWCAIITTLHCFHWEKRGEDWCSVTKWLYGQLKWKSCYLPCNTYFVMINKKRIWISSLSADLFSPREFFLIFLFFPFLVLIIFFCFLFFFFFFGQENALSKQLVMAISEVGHSVNTRKTVASVRDYHVSRIIAENATYTEWDRTHCDVKASSSSYLWLFYD